MYSDKDTTEAEISKFKKIGEARYFASLTARFPNLPKATIKSLVKHIKTLATQPGT